MQKTQKNLIKNALCLFRTWWGCTIFCWRDWEQNFHLCLWEEAGANLHNNMVTFPVCVHLYFIMLLLSTEKNENCKSTICQKMQTFGFFLQMFHYVKKGKYAAYIFPHEF